LCDEVWKGAAQSLGIDVGIFIGALRNPTQGFDRKSAEQLFAERLAALPASLTEHETVIDRRELVRAVAAALVGTGLPIERAHHEVGRLLGEGVFVEIGRDTLGLPRYSTPEMLRIG
jgi:hypothetical protein